MIFEQHYLECLSQASYLIADETTGTAAVVDPRRDIGVYLDAATNHRARIELVIQTHFHADFVSGHLELAAATGASIAFGPGASTDYPIRHLADGERISLGDVTLEILHTPGHTPESISVVVYEHATDAHPYAVLTGDALFVGDVGRPDLLVGQGLRAQDQAGVLYDSLHTKLLTLPDQTMVFPGHGAGSACGKNISPDLFSTIGHQRHTNEALAETSKHAFAARVATGQPLVPRYFPHDVALNRSQRALLDEAAPVEVLTPAEARCHRAAGAQIVDTRDPEQFAAGHLPGSVNIPASARFAELAGKTLRPDTDIVIVAAVAGGQDERNRLARIGYDRVIGVLDRLPDPETLSTMERLDPPQLCVELDDPAPPRLLDVREPAETVGGVVEGAMTIPLGQLPDRLGDLDSRRRTVVYCASGIRSSVAASLLVAAGFTNVADLRGGYGAWLDTPRLASGFSLSTDRIDNIKQGEFQ